MLLNLHIFLKRACLHSFIGAITFYNHLLSCHLTYISTLTFWQFDLIWYGYCTSVSLCSFCSITSNLGWRRMHMHRIIICFGLLKCCFVGFCYIMWWNWKNLRTPSYTAEFCCGWEWIFRSDDVIKSLLHTLWWNWLLDFFLKYNSIK